MSLLKIRPWFRFCLVSFFAFSLTAPSIAKWWRSESKGITCISNARKAEIDRKLETLWDAHLALELLFPSLVGMDDEELLVIYVGNAKTRDQLTFATGRRQKNITGFFTQDPDGHYAIISDGIGDGDFDQVAIHEYIHFLTTSSNRMPIWLSEGMAELFSTIHRNSKDELVIGDPLANSIRYLQYEDLMPSERLFAIDRSTSEYGTLEHSGKLYSQSWLFLHYLFFGENDLPRERIQSFLNESLLTPVTTEQTLEKHLGLDFVALDKVMEDYLQKGLSNRIVLSLDESRSYQPATLTEASDIEIARLYARVTLNTKESDESIPWIQKALDKWPEDPEINAIYGDWLLKNDKPTEAKERFQFALDQGYESPRAHLGFAASHFVEAFRGEEEEPSALSQADTLTCLTHLFKARQLGAARTPLVYLWIAHVWLNSEVQPEDKHMSVALEGLQRFPGNVPLASDLAEYYRRTDRSDKANALLSQTLPYLYKGERQRILDLMVLED